MTRAAAQRVRWIEAGLSRRLAMLGGTRLIVRAEPGAWVMWRADVRLRGCAARDGRGLRGDALSARRKPRAWRWPAR